MLRFRELIKGFFRSPLRDGEKNNVHFSKVGKGWSGSSINTSIFRKDSLVTHDGTQYISFYDKKGNIILGKRESGGDKWSLRKSGLKGNVKDAHNVISMSVDGDGFLHVVYDVHNKNLKYARSESAGSLKMMSLDTMDGIEEEMVTYPEFHKMSSGDLIFTYRSGISGAGDMILKHYSANYKKWQTLQKKLVDGEGERNAYWQMCVDKNDTIHISWVWRETSDVSTNHDLCYAKSPDGGKTWFTSDGKRYALPITVKTAEIVKQIPEGSELINQTGMGADSLCNPYIATYWKEGNDLAPQYRVVWFDGSLWHTSGIYERETSFELKGNGTKVIPISRPCILCDKEKVYVLFRDKELGGRITVAETEDIHSGMWAIKYLSDFYVEAWEPTVDMALWKKEGLLDVFVQKTYQIDNGDNKETVSSHPTGVYVLEYRP